MVLFRIAAREDLRSDLITSYNALLTARELIGLSVEDPKTSNSAVESQDGAKFIDEQYRALSSSTLGRTNIRSRLVNFFKGENDNLIRDLISDIKQRKELYSRRTFARRKCGILASLAFCSEEKLPIVMGQENAPGAFSDTWRLQFEQVCAEQQNIGLLDVTGITSTGLDEWWNEGHSDRQQVESRVWADVKSLALRIVCIFDKMGAYNDAAGLSTEADEILARVIKLALRAIRLIHLRPEQVDEICPLMELFVPVVHSFSLFIGRLSDRSWRSMQQQTISFLGTYLSSTESSCEDIVTRLGAKNELNGYEVHDATEFTTESIAAEAYQPEVDDTHELLQMTITKLRDLPLQEIQLVMQRDEQRFASGSFSFVYKFPGKEGSKIYAVKFMKVLNADCKRAQERLLREAKRWKPLNHKHINPLAGFVVHPAEPFPGLVSPLCECTLHDHIAMNPGGKVSNKEKLRYLKEITEAIVYCHGLQMAHGDLRPANVLLAKDNFWSEMTVKLADFGVSYLDDSQDRTTTKQHTNLQYLAPELKRTKERQGIRQVSLKGDIYAFGGCFLEVFYEAEMKEDTVSKLKTGDKHSAQGPELLSGSYKGKHIEIQYWKFMKSLWRSNADKRPSASEVDNLMLEFCT